MDDIIQQIVDTLKQLPESDQILVAKWLLEETKKEVESELIWNKLFEKEFTGD